MNTATKKRRSKISKGIQKICGNIIEWHLNGRELDLLAIDVERITDALIESRSEGELCTISPDGKTVGGWWSIQW
jgi:hypothetical protein